MGDIVIKQEKEKSLRQCNTCVVDSTSTLLVWGYSHYTDTLLNNYSVPFTGGPGDCMSTVYQAHDDKHHFGPLPVN